MKIALIALCLTLLPACSLLGKKPETPVCPSVPGHLLEPQTQKRYESGTWRSLAAYALETQAALEACEADRAATRGILRGGP